VIYLIVSFIWAFGLIKTHLSGLDPFHFLLPDAAFCALSLPLLRLRDVGRNAAFLAMIGMIQYGLMHMTTSLLSLP
jgi:hypothetical protein